MKFIPKSFEFVSYQFRPQKKEVRLNYKISFRGKKSLLFTEIVLLPKIPRLQKINPKLIDSLLMNIHLMLGVSYYKLYCPPKVILKKPLSKQQAEFWTAIYRKGLGEFFYRNNVDPKGSPLFPFKGAVKPQSFEIKKNNRVLVGIGGGKDSIVAAELLKGGRHDVTAFVLETQRNQPVTEKIVQLLDIDSLKIRRILDRQLFQDHEGSYNGHIPISGIIAFLGLLSAIFYKYSYIVVGNEHSSDFGNVKYKGEIINHQWSKSAEFENLFRNYVETFITPDIRYFSLLRPFYEIRVVEMFSKYKKYFSYFSSCNRNFKISSADRDSLWCGECPKCVFIFVLLSALLSKISLLKIFKKNLYTNPALLPTFRDILGFGKLKPFDCVGTFEEVRAAFLIARKKFKKDIAMKTFIPKIKKVKSYIKKVFSTNAAPNIPAQFRFLGMKTVLILGYGREGKVTRRYMSKYHPKLKIGVADARLEKDYLEKQNKYDLVIKTPGIPKRFVSVPYTTATNIFFSQIKNVKIGVTGSKGKSTTASLIYAILNEAGKKVRLLGNIGNPMLGALMHSIDPDEIFILELSSYQLDDIEFSPNTAVITNLFPEHMTYHKKLDSYYEAKRNIIKYQHLGDTFIYNLNNSLLKQWAKNCKRKAIPFVKNIPVLLSETKLSGKHNLENIKAAITTARIFNIRDGVIKRALIKFKPLSHRLQFVGEFKGIKFYDDAISTAPESTIAAIKAIPNVATIFLGGEDRGYDFKELEKTLRKSEIKNVVLFPESGRRILKSKRGFNVLKTSSMAKAVKFAYVYTPAGYVCLISTASPSYSLWKNFEEKGRQFQFFVRKYGKII